MCIENTLIKNENYNSERIKIYNYMRDLTQDKNGEPNKNKIILLLNNLPIYYLFSLYSYAMFQMNKIEPINLEGLKK